MRRPLALAVVALVVATATARALTYQPYPVVILGGMDKVTGRVSRFAVSVGDTVSFGTLEVTPRACRKTPPEERPVSAAFLQIYDTQGDTRERVFSGWMFSSSPGVSALEHPVYDIWVIDCVKQMPSSDPAR